MGDIVNEEMDQMLYWTWITTIKGLKRSRIIQLLEYYKTPEEIWRADLEVLKSLFKLTNEEIILLKNSKNPKLLKKWLYDLEQMGIFYYSINHPLYPSKLKNIPNPPLGLYVKGIMPSFDKTFLAMVGTRKCSEYGRRVAKKLAKELSHKGFGIISGLAEGIDTVAHIGTLEAGGFTVAVVANGLDICYPKSNNKLMKEIQDKGVLISEYPPGTKPIPGFFPARNRIISGLSEGVIVVEAGEKSGALITADLALEQGREVFAVPGSIFSSTSKGTHRLIQQGAKLVTDLDDIVSEIRTNFINNNSNRNLQYEGKIMNRLAIEENIVYDCISFEPSHIDVLSVKTHYPISQLQSILTLLELKGLIQQLPGKRFVRNQ